METSEVTRNNTSTEQQENTSGSEEITADCSSEATRRTEDCTETISSSEAIEILSEDVKQERIEEAQELKRQGNCLFKEEEFEKAVGLYTEALEVCPKTESKQIAILFANRAACSMKMKEYSQTIKDCTSALELDACYIKARLRRAQAYEFEEKLESALEDYQKVLELDRTCSVAGEAVMRLPDQIKERNEKLKDEMMGKLKELGNMVLKPFGLSTENFKMQQDPNTGGYSINFQK